MRKLSLTITNNNKFFVEDHYGDYDESASYAFNDFYELERFLKEFMKPIPTLVSNDEPPF